VVLGDAIVAAAPGDRGSFFFSGTPTGVRASPEERAELLRGGRARLPAVATH
jgi:hypothetical protein